MRQSWGTGSKTTIAGHLKVWKAGQGMDSNLPPALMNTISSLWNNLQDSADSRVQEQQDLLNNAKNEWQQALVEANAENVELAKQLAESHAVLEALRLIHQETTTQLVTEQLNLQLAQKELALREEQLTEAKAENTQLYQLAKRIQESFDHYQQAVQQKHTEHELILERQQTSVQQEIRQLREQLGQATEQVSLLRQQLQEKSTCYAHVESANAELKQQYQEVLNEAKQMQKDYLILQERYNMQQELQRKELHDRECMELLIENEKNKISLLAEANIRLTIEIERLSEVVAAQKNKNLL